MKDGNWFHVQMMQSRSLYILWMWFYFLESSFPNNQQTCQNNVGEICSDIAFYFSCKFSGHDVLTKDQCMTCDMRSQVGMCGHKLQCARAMWTHFGLNLWCACVWCIFRHAKFDRNFAHFLAVMQVKKVNITILLV